MQSATAQSTATDIIVNIRRFIGNPFSELSFGVLLQQPKCWLCPWPSQRHMTTSGGLESKFAVRYRVRRHSIRAVRRMALYVSVSAKRVVEILTSVSIIRF